ncbi:unnamed protein product [Caenorhabditis nigoni]|nr:hypothetical protein B9Z55_000716 [Caenorhabditis nigoni]
MHGLKCLRGAKLHSSTSVLTDRRFTAFSTYGTSFSPDPRQFENQCRCSYVEVERGFKTPLIALECSKGVKTLGLVSEYESGFVENSDPLGPNVVNNHPDWKEIRKVLTTEGTFSVRSFDVASA